MGLYKKLRKYITGRRMVWPPEFREDYTLEQINFRDPYIVKDGKGGYVMVGTVYHYNYNDSNMCLMYKSNDLRVWSGPYKIVDGDKLDKKYYDFWAPEIHIIDGRYFLAITLHPQGAKRGTYLFESDTLDGEYSMICRITPEGKNSLDGTLVCEGDEIWCTYCHEYIDVGDGHIRSVKLLADLSGIDESTDRLLFKASANTYKCVKSRKKVTDGPFYFRKDKELYLLWSTELRDKNYALLLAKSDDGTIYGNFSQEGVLFDKDGGHAMLFEDYDGTLKVVMHCPNARTVFTHKFEHPVIFDYASLKLIRN